MKKIIISILIFASLMILLGKSCCPKYYFSANPICNPGHSIFEEQNYDQEEYLNNVHQILATAKPEQFRYFRKTFLIENDTDYLVTNFRNEQYCFDVKMRLEDLGKLVGMKHKNGVAYPVELYDLKWSLETRNGKTEIIYLDMHRIID